MITPDTVKQAANILNSGGIIIFPTDTAFGIGCLINHPGAIDRLFTMRRRPVTQATPVLVNSTAMALDYWDKPGKTVHLLTAAYWPGALTIVAPARINRVYAPVRGGGDNLGIRMPDHDLILTIINSVGVPILGPSANFHGEPTPYTLSEVNPDLIKKADLVMDGKCPVGQVSTVIDAGTNPVRILRQGAVKVNL